MSRTFHHGGKAKKKRFGDDWSWWQSEPKWWNKLFHTKPKRRQEKSALHDAMKGDEEPTFPTGNRKPHNYYW